jgi:hypothetical protein
MDLDSLRRNIEAVVTQADEDGEIDAGLFTIKLARERVGESDKLLRSVYYHHILWKIVFSRQSGLIVRLFFAARTMELEPDSLKTGQMKSTFKTMIEEAIASPA